MSVKLLHCKKMGHGYSPMQHTPFRQHDEAQKQSRLTSADLHPQHCSCLLYISNALQFSLFSLHLFASLNKEDGCLLKSFTDIRVNIRFPWLDSYSSMTTKQIRNK